MLVLWAGLEDAFILKKKRLISSLPNNGSSHHSRRVYTKWAPPIRRWRLQTNLFNYR